MNPFTVRGLPLTGRNEVELERAAAELPPMSGTPERLDAGHMAELSRSREYEENRILLAHATF